MKEEWSPQNYPIGAVIEWCEISKWRITSHLCETSQKQFNFGAEHIEGGVLPIGAIGLFSYQMRNGIKVIEDTKIIRISALQDMVFVTE